MRMADGLEQFKGGVVLLVIIGLVAAGAALALDAFQNDVGEDVCLDNTNGHTVYNAATKVCRNTTYGTTDNTTTTPTATQWNVTSEGLEGTANATSYLSTIGTLLGVAALIAVVMAAFFIVGRRMQ
jgi:hypothetical protein